MATGYYHRYNVLKYRILSILAHYDDPMTAQEIANLLGGVERKKVTDALGYWQSEGYGYTQRMKRKADGTKAYRYKITKKGREILQVYINRMKSGMELNISKKNARVQSTVDYFGINKYGIEMGITHEKLLEIARVKPAKRPDPESQKAKLAESEAGLK